MYVATIIILIVTNLVSLFFYIESRKQEQSHNVVNFLIDMERRELQEENNQLRIENNILENRIELLERMTDV